MRKVKLNRWIDFVVAALLVCMGTLVCMIASGCASTPSSGQVGICGIVMDSKDAPVEGYDFFVDGKYVTSTNAQGLFILAGVCGSENEIVAEKQGWEKICFSGKECASNGVICLSVKNLHELLFCVERNIGSGNFTSAEELLNKFCGRDQELFKVQFLKSVVACKLGNYEAAVNELEKLKKGYWNKSLETYEKYLSCFTSLGAEAPNE